MKFEYEIRGITLNECEMRDIKDYYGVLCTAEYIMDNYDITDKDEAIKLATEVRHRMNDYDESEVNAIYEVLNKRERN